MFRTRRLANKVLAGASLYTVAVACDPYTQALSTRPESWRFTKSRVVSYKCRVDMYEGTETSVAVETPKQPITLAEFKTCLVNQRVSSDVFRIPPVLDPFPSHDVSLKHFIGQGRTMYRNDRQALRIVCQDKDEVFRATLQR